MKLSISNIAWNREENNSALRILKKYNIGAIDVAPTLLSDSIEKLTDKKVEKIKEHYESNKIKLVGMQSLLYGFPEISLFDGEKERNRIRMQLLKIFRIAKLLGIKKLIFGSPKNRFVRDFNQNIEEIALRFFSEIADLSEKNDICICFEANPKQYGCNFITDTFEAVNFAKKLNHPNFKINLDTSTIILNNNNFKEVFEYAKKYIAHIHVSSPHIKDILNINHQEILEAIKLIKYKGFISLEMKPNITDNNLKNLETNINIFVKCYQS